MSVSISGLARQLGCERVTLRAAIADLEAAGVLIRTGSTVVLVLEDTDFVPLDAGQGDGKSVSLGGGNSGAPGQKLTTPPGQNLTTPLVKNYPETGQKLTTDLLKKEEKKHAQAIAQAPAHEAPEDLRRPWGDAEHRLMAAIEARRIELGESEAWVQEMWRVMLLRAGQAQARRGRCVDELEKWSMFQWLLQGGDVATTG